MIRAASRVLSVVASAAVGAGVVIQALAAGAAATAPAAGSPVPLVASPSCGGTRAPACGPGSGGGASGDRIWAEQITVTVTSGPAAPAVGARPGRRRSRPRRAATSSTRAARRWQRT